MPHMLTQSDMVLTTGKQYLSFYEKSLQLKTFSIPIKFPPLRFYQLWHERVHHSPEHRWLREQIAQAAKSLMSK